MSEAQQIITAAVGTTNPAKLSAVSQALGTLFPNSKVDVRGVKVPSGVSDQPMTDDETIEGAINRAKNAMEAVPEADFGIGVEGGLQKVGDLYFGFGWTSVVDKKVNSKLPHSLSFTNPLSQNNLRAQSASVAPHDSKSPQITTVIDRVSGLVDNRSKAGAMGLMTSGILTRDSCYVHGIYFAFSQWISDAKYWIPFVMLVAVGTENRAKLSAVSQALATLFPGQTDIVVKGVAVASGVSDQPMSDDETIIGATNRANRAFAAVENADFGIGVEGGIHKIGEKFFDGGWVVVVDRQGKTGIGCSARYELSNKIMDLVLKGDELGVVMDKLTGQADVKQGAGAMDPLIAHKISLLRDSRVKPKQFRELVSELGLLIGYHATQNLDLIQTKELESPVAPFTGVKLKDTIAIFPIMRAGLGLVDPLLQLIPSARVHHLGLYREHSTLLPVEYYNKLPAQCTVDIGIVVDPMIATGGTAVAAINVLKDWGLKKIKFIGLIGSTLGIKVLTDAHPDVEVYVGVIDDEMTDAGYIVPGCGDAGDRIFKTL
ncbi:hypothetical protein HDU98_010389 [Podochytrium sp. JEL0797]|nr:hypothetical protein HDU98_010389 [Podochytrium sp. JEL0797]